MTATSLSNDRRERQNMVLRDNVAMTFVLSR